ncbi:MAG: hypothetical protein KJO29_04200 [Bacteroidia bacterium]|nr:hypothetical protein [Bacteroidia bacterium]
MKKLLLGTVAGTIVGFAGGFLVFGLALGNYMMENTNGKDPMDMTWLIIGHVFFALALTYIFMQWAGIKTAITGARAAANITLLISLGSNFIWYATSGLFNNLSAAVVDAAGATIVWAIGGAAIGWVLGRGD